MQIPIVLTAFGTTSRARTTYELMDRFLRKEFPGHEVHWAYSSRMVRDQLKHRKNLEIRHTYEVLEDLQVQGHKWAVVQSCHLICGHEFYRLLTEVNNTPLRVSIGLPLLSSPEDYRRVAQGLGLHNLEDGKEAVVLVGHGTDHPAWATYLAMETVLQEVWGPGIYVGAVEGYPSQERVVAAVSRAGLRRVRLIPFMLVAGVHYLEDLCEGEDSWKASFEKEGFEVSVEPQGLGVREEIMEIFLDHIREALDIIPATDARITPTV